MTERPILFSAPMVLALLAGTKTQTRRIVNPQPIERGAISAKSPPWCSFDEKTLRATWCRQGKPGDRLWVRETWRPQPDNQCERITYAADGAVAFENKIPESWQRPVAATRGNVPGIHMPRWASRILLEVTAVRVERLGCISESDAKAEGVEFIGAPGGLEDWRAYGGGPNEVVGTAATSFMTLWNSINGPGSWQANPWVWVVEFRRVFP